MKFGWAFGITSQPVQAGAPRPLRLPGVAKRLSGQAASTMRQSRRTWRRSRHGEDAARRVTGSP